MENLGLITLKAKAKDIKESKARLYNTWELARFNISRLVGDDNPLLGEDGPCLRPMQYSIPVPGGMQVLGSYWTLSLLLVSTQLQNDSPPLQACMPKRQLSACLAPAMCLTLPYCEAEPIVTKLILVTHDNRRQRVALKLPTRAGRYAKDVFYWDQGLEPDKHKIEDTSNDDVFRFSGAKKMQQGSVSYHGPGNL